MMNHIIWTIFSFWSNTKLRHWKGTQKEHFIFYWCHPGGSGYKIWKVHEMDVFTAGLVWYDHGDNNVWNKIIWKWNLKCRGVHDECPSYDACFVHRMARSLWWVSIIWCESIICMLGIHHTLCVPKASRHLQHKHQERTLYIIMTD